MKKAVGIAALLLLAFAAMAYANGSGGGQQSAKERLAAHEEALLRKIGNRATASISARRGPRGPRGPRGATGATGPAGSFSAIKQVLGPEVFVCSINAPSCAVQEGTATCPPGTVVIGGGEIGTATPFISTAISSSTWSIAEYNEASVSTQFRAVAECASP